MDLPPVPADIKACFGAHTRVPVPPAGALTQKQLAALIASLKLSELAHDQCGQRLIAWYESLAAGMQAK